MAMMGSKEIYKNSPKLERSEKGNMQVSKKVTPAEKRATADNGEVGGMPVHDMHAHERREMKHRHSHEKLQLHSRHEAEHDMHKGHKGMLHDKHEREDEEMHTRHEGEQEAMHDRHEQEMPEGRQDAMTKGAQIEDTGE